MSNSTRHPQQQQLVDFGLGKLGPDQTLEIEEHLDQCEECHETLLNLADDTFTGLVRSLPEPREEPLAHHASASESSADAEHSAAAEGLSTASELAVEVVADEPSHAATMLVQSGDSIAVSELPDKLQNHPRYQIIGQIGQGGMGDVYRAEHRLMNRSVALKVINSQLVKHPQAVERFRREVQAAAQLTHPNIVTAFDAEQAGDVHFLVMEFVEGTDLATVVKHRGALPVDEACDCIRQAAEGLQHAHVKGMVHRDIKPHNLMLSSRESRVEGPERQSGGAAGSGPSTLDSRRTVKILDFGLAGFATESAIIEGDSASGNEGDTPLLHLTTLGSVMGTPDYIAPEQARDAHSADIRADIYSLGCTLYFLLSGKPPHKADSVVDKLKAHAEREPEAIESVRVDVPEELADVVRRMMARDPAERFQTPAEVADALAPFVDQHRSDGDDGRGGSDNSLPTAIAEPMRFGHRVLTAAGVLSIVAAILSISNRGWITFQYPEWCAPWLTLGGMLSLPVGLLLFFGARRLSRNGSQPLTIYLAVVSLLPLNAALVAMLPLTIWLIQFLWRRENLAVSPSRTMPTRGSWSRAPRWACLATSSLIGAGLLGVIIHFATDSGQLVIELDDPSLLVRITRNGREMRVSNEGGTRITFLPSGDYDITIPGNDKRCVVTPSRVEIYRGAHKFVTIRRVTSDQIGRTDGSREGTDHDRLQGKWVPIAGHMKTKAMSTEQLAQLSVTFEGNRVTMTDPDGGGEIPAGTFTIDTKRDPKHITLSAPDGSETLSGIFQFEFDEEAILVEIDARNVVMVDEVVVANLNELPKVLKSTRKTEVLITAHENSMREVVVQVLDAAKEIGLQIIGVWVQRIRVGANRSSNRLKLAWIDEDYARPTDFSPSDKPDHMTVVLERAPLTGPTLGVEWRKVLTAAETFVALLDKGTFGGAYDSLSAIGKRPVTRGQFSNSVQKLQDAFGKVTTRTLHKVRLMDSFPGQPEGRYAGVQFKSDFERQKGAWESVLLNLDTNGEWRVNTYANTLELLPFPESKRKPSTPPPSKPSVPTPPATRGPGSRPERTGILTNPPSVPPGGLPVGKNLIADPSLEATPTGSLPKSWSAWLDDGPDFKCEVVEGGVTGKHCLQISGTGTRGVVFCTSVPMDRTKRYALKGRVKVEGDADTWAVIKLNYFNKTGWLGVDDRVGVASSDFDWKFFEKTDLTDKYPTATLIVPTCHIEGNGTAWFDDLEVIAYGRDTLPANFDAKHGKNNR